MGVRVGTVVLADFGDQVDGVQDEICAFVRNGPNDNGQYGIQAPNGHVVPMELVHAQGGGGSTFRLIEHHH